MEFVLIRVQNGSGDKKIMNVFIIPEGSRRGFHRIERWGKKIRKAVLGIRYWEFVEVVFGSKGRDSSSERVAQSA
jgi:hypothetical protein